MTAQALTHYTAQARIAELETEVARLKVDVEPESMRLLAALTAALDGAFISSWQSTAAWSKELDDALDFIAASKGA